MKIFKKELYSDRKGDSSVLVTKVIPIPVLRRILSLIRESSVVSYREGILKEWKTTSIQDIFLKRLYYHLKDRSEAEKFAHRSWEYLERYCYATNLHNLFDVLELFCDELKRFDGNSEDEDSANNLHQFIENFNDLLIKNGVPYKLTKDQNKDTKITVLSESKFIEKKVLKFCELTSNPKFAPCEKKFIEAENCFAKRDFDGVLTKCNSTLETLFSIVLDAGSRTLNKVYPEFIKKFKLPRVYEDYIILLGSLIEKIQNARSQYSKDVHGKHPKIDKEKVEDFIEEIAELILGQTASFGVYIIKIYQKTNE